MKPVVLYINNIDIDLGSNSLVSVMEVVKKKNYGISDLFIHKISTQNDITICYIQDRSPQPKHLIHYQSENQLISIRSTFSLYLCILMTMLLLASIILGIFFSKAFFILPIFVVIFIGSLISESNEIKREIIIRANYLARQS